MKYRNAQDIFPERLLRQIQRYVSGETIYIPAGSERKSWGETSGYQQFIRERNAEIREKFSQGASFDELMEAYSLSYDSIKRIVYSRKEISRLPMPLRENSTYGSISTLTRMEGTSHFPTV